MKNGSYGKKELEHFKNIILEKRTEIIEQLKGLRESALETTIKDATGDHSAYSFHMADQGTDAMEREKAFALASREEKFLTYLNDALYRIERGEYGVCRVCGNLIQKERLEAVPHTQICITCKSREEKRY
jgi:RNA polymerase-binding protein DksA